MKRFWVVLAAMAVMAIAPAAHAYEFNKPLKPRSSGKDVVELQIRIAGWYTQGDQARFPIDGDFGRATKAALMAFERSAGLPADGVADADVYKALHALEDADGSTAHFDWAEFEQHSSAQCSKRANRYAGTFDGGPIPKKKVRSNVRRVMWRLEALRAKADGAAIEITSGFRSVAYNKCIGGASMSQHQYGTAADIRVAGTANRKVRDLAKTSQFSGIGCYSDMSHNHLDLRLENRGLEDAMFWWWPDQDKKGHDLAYDGKPCLGEIKKARALAPLGLDFD
jgi:zinc D-Ala-D-Ala carboxypeptidase